MSSVSLNGTGTSLVFAGSGWMYAGPLVLFVAFFAVTFFFIGFFVIFFTGFLSVAFFLAAISLHLPLRDSDQPLVLQYL